MQSDPEERLSSTEKRRRPQWALAAVAAAVIAIAVFYFQKEAPQPVATVESTPPRIEPPLAALVLPPAPDIPVPVAEPTTAPTEVAEPVALTLEVSDQELRSALADAGDSKLLKTTLETGSLVQRCASVVDSVNRGSVPYKALPIKPPAGKFSIIQVKNQRFLDPASYQRYDAYAAAIAGLNTDTLVLAFNKFRPLLEQAYAGLGYRAEDFDNAVIRSLDRILATPELRQPIVVKRKESIYLHADSQLEALSDVQKLLIRMGPDNVALVKGQAQALRSGLLGPAAL
jgi:hypothetical protein